MDENLDTVGRVGIIGDVHCQSHALERVIGELQSQRLDLLMCVGDIVDGPGDADRTCELLMSANVECVAGNHERWLLAGERRGLDYATQEVTDRTRQFLTSLPAIRLYKTNAGRLMLCHGVGQDDEAALRPDTRGYGLQDIPTLRELMLHSDVDFMIGGHTHERMVRPFAGLTVVNAGTIWDKYEQTFLTIDFPTRKLCVLSAAEDDVGAVVEEGELPLPLPLK